MSQPELPEGIPQPRVHPVILQVREFLDNVFTEQEFYARVNAILGTIDPNIIIEAGKQLKEMQATQSAE